MAPNFTYHLSADSFLKTIDLAMITYMLSLLWTHHSHPNQSLDSHIRFRGLLNTQRSPCDCGIQIQRQKFLSDAGD